MRRFSLISASIFATAVLAISVSGYSKPVGQDNSLDNDSDSSLVRADANLPGPDQSKIEEFLKNQGYKAVGWHHDPNKNAHLSGQTVDGIHYTAHGFIEVYYSDGIEKWINPKPGKDGSKPGPAKVRDALANNEMIVALQYASDYQPPTDDELKAGQKPGVPERILSMVRSTGDHEHPGPHDGWYWSQTYLTGPDGKQVDDKKSSGKFGDSRCFSCHASANNESLVFLNRNAAGADIGADWVLADLKVPGAIHAVRRTLYEPHKTGDKEFLKYYGLDPVAKTDFDKFPAKKHDHVFAPRFGQVGRDMKHQNHFITSDQCNTCHNASQLYSNTKPNMWYPEPYPETSLTKKSRAKDENNELHRNFSPYGEWSASLNGLSGRDPVWHAQVEFERRLRPGLAQFTTATCFSCHGPMAGRQLEIDGKKGFNIEMFYATEDRGSDGKRDDTTHIGPDSNSNYAKYGALARDGVSCAVCHQISGKDLGVDPEFDMDFPTRHLNPDQLKSYTASFKVETESTKNAFWGPYEEGKLTESKVASAAMDKALGLRARYGPLLEEGSPFLNASDELKKKPQIHESKLCGSCHTVIVPALRVGYEIPTDEDEKKKYKSPFHDPTVKMSFEQTTYFEWRNSRYENEIAPKNATAMTCQACHMASHRKHDDFPKFDSQRIVNVLSDRHPPASGRAPKPAITYTKKDPIYRHVLLGINYFVFEMYEQFPELLGSIGEDANVPEGTLHPLINARDWIENHAERITADVAITGLQETKDNLEVEVEITNLAGHKFPTGAGFRRAFIKFEVLDEAGKPLWISGRTSSLGVLLDGNAETLVSEQSVKPWDSQNHHEIITNENQVQIYETRALNSERKLQTTVLGIYHEYKDNRILPNGWMPLDEPKTEGGEEDHGPPKQNRNLHYSMEPVLVRQADKDQVHPPGRRLHPVLENIKRDGGKTPKYADYKLDDKIRPREIGKGFWGEEETEAFYDYVEDPDYFDRSTYVNNPHGIVGAQRGQDHVIYSIPLADIDGWADVRARLYYQTIPPYFLMDRFKETKNERGGDLIHGPDLKRLAYMASHLNLDETPAKNWSLPIGKPATATKNDLGKRARKTNAVFEKYISNRLREHYIYLDLPDSKDSPSSSTSKERKPQ